MLQDGLAYRDLFTQRREEYFSHAEIAWNNTFFDTHLRLYKGEIPLLPNLIPMMTHDDNNTYHIMDFHHTFLGNHIALEGMFPHVIFVLFPFMDDAPPPGSLIPHTLQDHERAAIRSDSSLMDRLHYSYMMFVDFFGWKIHNQHNGELDRSKAYKERYAYLGEGSGKEHLWDSWTRVLRSLTDFMLHRYARYAVKYMIDEIVKGRLGFLRGRLETVWIPMMVDPDDRIHFARKLEKLDKSDS
eukprot:PhF_6_TR38711/c0_g1_i2/m.57936